MLFGQALQLQMIALRMFQSCILDSKTPPASSGPESGKKPCPHRGLALGPSATLSWACCSFPKTNFLCFPDNVKLDDSGGLFCWSSGHGPRLWTAGAPTDLWLGSFLQQLLPSCSSCGTSNTRLSSISILPTWNTSLLMEYIPLRMDSGGTSES